MNRADVAAIREAMAPVAHLRVLPHDQQAQLAQRAQAGCLASRSKLTRHSLRLVAKLSLQMATAKVPAADLFQLGAIALIKAIELFDDTRGVRFSTFAHRCVARSVAESARYDGDLVRVPATVKRAAARVARAIDRGEDPSAALRAERGACSDTIRKAIQGSNQLLGDAAAAELADEQARARGGEASAASAGPGELARLLGRLSDRERRYLRLTFGLGEGPAMTHGEVAKAEGVSRQRVSQVVARALAKLRWLTANR